MKPYLTIVFISVLIFTQCVSSSVKLDSAIDSNGISLTEGTIVRYDELGEIIYIYPVAPLEINGILFPERSKIYLSDSGMVLKVIISEGLVISDIYYYPQTTVYFNESGTVDRFTEEGPSEWPWF